MVTAVPSEVKAFDFLTVLIEEDKVRIMVRNEVDLQTFVRVSMARFFDEPAGFRQLIQSSSRATLNLCTVRALDDHFSFRAPITTSAITAYVFQA